MPTTRRSQDRGSAPRLERVFEESRVRRGRKATSPVWYVHLSDGSRWRFVQKRAAQAFIDAGAVCAQHERVCCRHCHGWREREPEHCQERVSPESAAAIREIIEASIPGAAELDAKLKRLWNR